MKCSVSKICRIFSFRCLGETAEENVCPSRRAVFKPVSFSRREMIKVISSLDRKTKEDCLAEVLVTVSFWANYIFFMRFLILRHAQYFIAFAPFIAFYFSDFIFALEKIFQKIKIDFVFWILFLGLLGVIGIKGMSINMVKSRCTNRELLDQFTKTQKIIPLGSYVFDLSGMALFYKDPYYICSVPYGQYIEAFRFHLPRLSKALEKTDTKYVFLGDPGKLGVIPIDEQHYILENYKMVETNPAIMERKNL